ncbi:MAG: lamin tail domain-containing protein [Myxococcota bacterium]|nr:lamin tail domain-containing protein [Myxococcota bacterium]
MLLFLLACGAPEGRLEQVGYRDGTDSSDGTSSGERGNIKISEVLWSGSVDNDGNRDASDVFVEIRNEGVRPINLQGWFIDQEGTIEETYVIRQELWVQVGEHVFLAAKDTGCFPEPDALLPKLRFGDGDPFRLTLKDSDERLIEPAGSKDMPPYAGGYDYVRSRSMEKVELMFGGRGTEPSAWHYYTPAEVDVANNDRISEDCQRNTLASPGRPNSPDYSGAYSTGSFE